MAEEEREGGMVCCVLEDAGGVGLPVRGSPGWEGRTDVCSVRRKGGEDCADELLVTGDLSARQKKGVGS